MSSSVMRAIALAIAALRWVGEGDSYGNVSPSPRPESVLKDAEVYYQWITNRMSRRSGGSPGGH